MLSLNFLKYESSEWTNFKKDWSTALLIRLIINDIGIIEIITIIENKAISKIVLRNGWIDAISIKNSCNISFPQLQNKNFYNINKKIILLIFYIFVNFLLIYFLWSYSKK